MNKLSNKEFAFMKYRWFVILTSTALMIASVFLLAKKGLNYGIDFKGGLSLIYQFEEQLSEKEITQALANKNLPEFTIQKYSATAEENAEQGFMIRSEVEDKAEALKNKYTKILQEKFGADKVQLIQEEFVGPSVGKELRTKGIYAIFWACIIILVYIGFRFDFYFAPGAIIALIHDVLLSLGAFAITQREVNLTVVAAFLTIVGYSINDTIIIFDRIRENIQRYKGRPLASIIDRSVTQTLIRSILTSLTVFFVVFILFMLTDGDIQNFSFAMICGVVFGTYSSIFIAAPIFLFFREHGHRFGIKQKEPRPVKSS
ncbi:MAG: protein translocase subunit SecF [Deltaproteobacteria bacterium]|nr:protein translocase subunit SecF [Deltaproteobacteria bacterium]